MADVTDIIDKLLERTIENKVAWKTTADEDTFIAVIGNASASVNLYYDRQYSPPDQEWRFRILNSEGREIESYDTGLPGISEVRTALIKLHSMARRVALGVDSQLDDLLKALEE